MIYRRPTLIRFVMLVVLLGFPRALRAESSFYENLTSPDAAVRQKAVHDFQSFPPDLKQRLVPDIMVATRDDNPDVQQAAQDLLKSAQAAKPQDGPDLTQELPKPSRADQNQNDAMNDLQHAKQEAFPDMKAALDEEKGKQNDLTPEEARAEGSGSSASSALLVSLQDPDPLVRAHAAQKLSQVHPIPLEAIEPLTNLMSDKDRDVRAAAAGTLGSIGPAAKSTIPVLLRSLADPDPGVRQIVGDALKEIQEPQ